MSKYDLGAIRTTLPYPVRFGCVYGAIGNTVQSYNIITIYASIIVLKNVKRVKIVVLRQKTNSNGRQQKRYCYTSMEMAGGMDNYIII